MEHEARFEQKENFYKVFSRYSLRTEKFSKKNDDGAPDDGNGGAPLAWREEDKTIFLDASDSHTLIIGSTGSKKSRLFVMPTIKLLGCASESIIVTDPKGEIYNRTASDLKKNNYEITVINLRNPREGDSWNPLYIPYTFYRDGRMAKAYEFVNDIGTNLMLAETSTQDPYWDNAASDLFLGLTLLLFRICKENNLPPETVNINNLLRLRRKMFFEYMKLRDFMELPIGKYIKNDEIIEASLIGSLGNVEKTQQNIVSLFDSKMRVFVIHPELSQMLSKGNRILNSVGQKKTAVFLIMPDEKTSYHKLISVFIKQSYEYFIYQAQGLPNKKMPVRINYVLDEFSSLPTIEDFPAMISAARSRKIRFNLVVQSQHQLEQRYGKEAETIKANCANLVFLTSRELPLLKDLADLCGTRAGGKPLISVHELQILNKEKGEVLILRQRLRAFIGYLPDIDEYDNKKYESTEYPLQNLTHNDSIQEDFNNQLDKMFINKTVNTEFFSWHEKQSFHKNRSIENLAINDSNELPQKNQSIDVNDLDTGNAGKNFEIAKSTTNNILQTFVFPNINDNRYEFALVKSDDKVYLTDQGITLKRLDVIFELREPDVIKNLVAIQKQYGVEKRGNEFVISFSSWYDSLDMNNNDELDRIKFRLFACVSFMLNMKIFYV
jgi:type IV secretion system protein VirD4